MPLSKQLAVVSYVICDQCRRRFPDESARQFLGEAELLRAMATLGWRKAAHACSCPACSDASDFESVLKAAGVTT